MTIVSPGDDLQAIITAAAPSTTLLLGDGIYAPEYNSEKALYIGKSLTLRAVNSGKAIIDGQTRRQTIYIQNAGNVELDGLHITRGSATLVRPPLEHLVAAAQTRDAPLTLRLYHRRRAVVSPSGSQAS